MIRRYDRALVLTTQAVILVASLAAWELVPKIPEIDKKAAFLDPFFISSPTKIVTQLYKLATGANGNVVIWPFVWVTLSSSLLGVAIGMVAGGALGLVLSSSRFLSRVFHPFLAAINAIPRIALIPIVVIILGPTAQASAAIGVMVVFFIAFYNAYEGGRSVPVAIVQNATILGASRFHVIRYLRFPYSMGWMIATLPLASTFALLTVVTGEILTGTGGLGRLLTLAFIASDATLTFAIVVVLSVVGVAISWTTEIIRGRVLHWWESSLA